MAPGFHAAKLLPIAGLGSAEQPVGLRNPVAKPAAYHIRGVYTCVILVYAHILDVYVMDNVTDNVHVHVSVKVDVYLDVYVSSCTHTEKPSFHTRPHRLDFISFEGPRTPLLVGPGRGSHR